MWNYVYKTGATLLVLALVFFLDGLPSTAAADEDRTPGQKANEAHVETHAHGGVMFI